MYSFRLPSLLLACLITFKSIGQIELNQNYIEGFPGDFIEFKVNKKDSIGTIRIKNPPKGTAIDSLGTFTWVIPDDLAGRQIMIDFQLHDSTGLLDVSSVLFKVLKITSNPPKIEVSSNQGDNKTVYHVQLGERLELNIKAKASSSKKAGILLNYYFNENELLKSLEGSDIKLADNELSLVWTPSMTNLNKEFISFTVTATESSGQTTKKTFLLIIRKNNQSPYFIYPVLEEYYIAPNETLNINIAAGDPDGDSLIYRLDIPTKIGNPQLSERGRFLWRLNDDQIMRMRRSFPVEVTVEATEVGTDNPHTIVKRFKVLKSVRNQPPKILNLQNERIPEGLTYSKTVFVQDSNDDPEDLKVEIRGAPEGMTYEFDNDMLRIEWTPGFDVIGVDMKPENFDMLLVVSDPFGFVDQRAFTIVVEHRENTELTYQHYEDYRDEVITMIETLAQINQEMVERTDKIDVAKKGLSVSTMVFGTFTAIGSTYEQGSTAQNMIPYVGALAVVAGGFNAFGFNDLPKLNDIREKSFVLQQKLMQSISILSDYDITGPNSPNLENVEFRDNLRTLQKGMINDKLEFKRLYANYLTLSYVKRAKRKQSKEARALNQKPTGILYLDMNEF